MITKHYNMKRTLLFFTAAILMISGASCQSKDNTTNQQRALKAQQTITPLEVAPIEGLDTLILLAVVFGVLRQCMRV